MTIGDLIKSSLRVCHVLAKSEAPSADEMQDSVQALQFMLDQWGADNLMVWSNVSASFALTAGKNEYTIGLGVGNDIVAVYPYKITDAFIRDGNTVDTGLDILTRTEYNSYADKIIATARPQALLYEQGVASQASPSGTIILYPIPDASSAYTLFYESLKPLVSIVKSTDDFTLLAPYEEAIKYNLAIRLWDEYHDSREPIPQHILRMASDAKKTIARNTIEFAIAPMSIPSVSTGIWNILSDTENG